MSVSSCTSRARPPSVSDESSFFFAASVEFRRIMENRRLRAREDGCMTQIPVARAPPSPQFYCAYRSIQAARISPGARLEILHGSAFASRRRPPASFATTLLSLFPLGAAPRRCRLAASSCSPSSFTARAVKFNRWTSVATIFFFNSRLVVRELRDELSSISL